MATGLGHWMRCAVMLGASAGPVQADAVDWDRLQQAPTPLAALALAASWPSDEPATANRLVQEMARLHAEAGETTSALATFPFGPGGASARPPAASLDDLGPDFRCEAAHPIVMRLARSARFVFINEAHHVPQTRALTFDLLRGLRAQGFTHLALEALNEPGATLAARGHPATSSGTYLQEPVSGELVREALRLGYRIVDYEYRGDGEMEDREAAQAAQLWDRTVGADPRARVLVHAGYAHVDLAVGRLWEVLPLAGRIAARAPGEVLSIDQVDLRHDPKRREHPLYRPLQSAFPASEPQACLQGSKPWALDGARNTLSIVLPDPGPDERPGWLALGGARRGVPAPALCGDALPCLIEARHASEGEDAVPSDRCVQRAAVRCMLYLRPGAFRLRGSGADGAARAQLPIRVGD